jgi:hypothetical protein
VELKKLEEKEETNPLSCQENMKRNALLSELHQLLDEEELFWYRRCDETWLLKGDNNTECFHRCANGRRRKQSIFSLEDGENKVSGTENLLRHDTCYYKNLFGPSDGDNFLLDQDLRPEEEQVSISESENLTREFTKAEIKEALYQMEKNKAAGPDGFPIEFFQVCWHFLKLDILKIFKDMHDGKFHIRRLILE